MREGGAREGGCAELAFRPEFWLFARLFVFGNTNLAKRDEMDRRIQKTKRGVLFFD